MLWDWVGWGISESTSSMSTAQRCYLSVRHGTDAVYVKECGCIEWCLFSVQWEREQWGWHSNFPGIRPSPTGRITTPYCYPSITHRKNYPTAIICSTALCCNPHHSISDKNVYMCPSSNMHCQCARTRQARPYLPSPPGNLSSGIQARLFVISDALFSPCIILAQLVSISTHFVSVSVTI